MPAPQHTRTSAGSLRRALARNWRLAAGVTGVLLVVTLVGVRMLPQVESSKARPPASLDRKDPLLALQTTANPDLARQQLDRQVAWISGKRKLLQDELAEVETKLLAGQSDLNAVEGRIQSLRERIARLPPDGAIGEGQLAIPTSPSTTIPSVRHDRSSLSQLESRERELAATRNDNHPQLQAIRQQLADLRAAHCDKPLAAALPTTATQAVQPSRQALNAHLHTEQSLADTLRRRQQSLLSLKAQLEGDLRRLLNQETTLAQTPLDSAVQGPLDGQLHGPQSSSPTGRGPVLSPTSAAGPWRAIVFALGLVISVLGGLVAALVAAKRHPVLRSRVDLERLWDLPLVAVLPPRNSPAT